jgi:hypothetical protein
MTVNDLLRDEQAMTSWTNNMVKVAELGTQAAGFPADASAET